MWRVLERVAAILLLLLSVGAAVAARAASYVQVDGTVVDPIQLVGGGPHPYAGPDLGPGVSAPDADLREASLAGAWLDGAQLPEADFVRADLSGASLIGANLDDARFYSADLSGADLSQASLEGASLAGADITGAVFQDAIYSSLTLFPAGFDPEAAGMKTGVLVINNGLAPPNPENVISFRYSSDTRVYVNNAGCDATQEYPCASPGAATTVTGYAPSLIVHETSIFEGTVRDRLTARDESTATVSPSFDGSLRILAEDRSNVTATDCVICSLSATDDAHAVAEGSYQDVTASGRSTVLLPGLVDGGAATVRDEALLELSGFATGLVVDGGRAILSGDTNGVTVGREGHLEIRGGNTGLYYTNLIRGTAEISDGVIGGCELLVKGYAEITGGRFVGSDDGGCLFGRKTPPWGFITENRGLIDLRGGELDPALAVAAREASRIRIFGSGFAVDGEPVPYGTLEAETGTLTGTLAEGGAVANLFAHRGAQCGPAPCLGRIVLLADGEDWDADGVPNDDDNCVEEPNADQADADDDGAGDACDVEVDPDGWKMTDHGPLPTFFSLSNEGGALNGLLQAAGQATDLRSAAIATPGGPAVPLPIAGWERSTANAVNDLGGVTGNGVDPDGASRGFVGDASGIFELPTLGGDSSYGSAINNLGHVAGFSRTASGERHAFHWDGATLIDLGTLGTGQLSLARAISDSGFVTGLSQVAAGSSDDHAFLYAEGEGLRDLGTLGGSYSVGLDVSENGYVTGDSYPADGRRLRAFFWNGQEMIDLGEFAPGEGSTGLGVNSAGWVTGSSKTPLGDTHAFVWDGVEMVDLGAIDPASDRSEGVRMLEDGTVVGTSRSEDGRLHVVTWTEADGVPASADNCPADLNPDQADSDGDGTGDACNDGEDADGDEWADALDNCALVPNPRQADRNGNGIGNRCELPVVLWAGVRSCHGPREHGREKRRVVRARLRDGETIRVDPAWSGCFGLQVPGRRRIASAHFRHVAPDGSVSQQCVEGRPLVMGLGPRSDACVPGLGMEGAHAVDVTVYDAPGCEEGGGTPQPAVGLGFTVAAPETSWHRGRWRRGSTGAPWWSGRRCESERRNHRWRRR